MEIKKDFRNVLVTTSVIAITLGTGTYAYFERPVSEVSTEVDVVEDIPETRTEVNTFVETDNSEVIQIATTSTVTTEPATLPKKQPVPVSTPVVPKPAVVAIPTPVPVVEAVPTTTPVVETVPVVKKPSRKSSAS